jgi:Phage integrase family
MRWEQIDLKAGLVHVSRLKNGLASTHPIRGPELRALRELRRDYPETPYLFVTERGGPMTPATARKLIARAGELAKLPFPIHPHMLRHSAGYKLANEGHDTRSIQQYLGHRNIMHTVPSSARSGSRIFGRIERRKWAVVSQISLRPGVLVPALLAPKSRRPLNGINGRRPLMYVMAPFLEVTPTGARGFSRAPCRDYEVVETGLVVESCP